MDSTNGIQRFLFAMIQFIFFVSSDKNICSWKQGDNLLQNVHITYNLECSKKINLELIIFNRTEVHIKCQKNFFTKTEIKDKILKLIPPFEHQGEREIVKIKINNCSFINASFSSLAKIFTNINELEVNVERLYLSRKFFDSETFLKKLQGESNILYLEENFFQNLPELETFQVEAPHINILGNNNIFANAVKLINFSVQGDMPTLPDNSFYNSTNIEHFTAYSKFLVRKFNW